MSAKKTGFRTWLVNTLAQGLGMATRGMTLGVRCAAFDAAGRVCLVRHTYLQGFYLPGGGVERGETFEMALERELEEEAAVRLCGPARLFGLYFNRTGLSRDHVALYVARDITCGTKIPDREIAQCGFFALDALPESTTEATRARLGEIAGAPVSPYW